MNETVYTRLREFLDQMPNGYPATDTGVEIKILKKLFSPEDAEFVMHLKAEPETVPVIAQRLRISESSAAAKLKDLTRRGLIFSVRDGGDLRYNAIQFLTGIFDFQLNHMDKEYAELIEEYIPFVAKALLPLPTKQARIVPVNSAVDTVTNIQPYNRIPALLASHDVIAVAHCRCRKEQGLLGHTCDRPSEVCFMFGSWAQYYIDNKMGRQIDKDEAMRLFALAEASGLVLCSSNTQRLAFICSCCPCCCVALRLLKQTENPAALVSSYYRTTIDAEACNGCGLCLDRCQLEALAEKDGVVDVNPARCIGCGLCISVCPTEALALEEKLGGTAPPLDLEDWHRRLASDRRLSH